MVACDREAAEQDGPFGTLVAGLRPDAVVDLTCFTPAQARQLVDALDGQHVVQTGSVWSYGPSTLVPTTEDAPKHPYGRVRRQQARHRAVPDGGRIGCAPRVVHPGHISGPGWMPIGPAGNLDPAVIDSLRADGSCLLPDRGGETIHHVHAEDVASLHQACLEQPDAADGRELQQRLHPGADPARVRRARRAALRSRAEAGVRALGGVRLPRRPEQRRHDPRAHRAGARCSRWTRPAPCSASSPGTASPTPSWSPSTPGSPPTGPDQGRAPINPAAPLATSPRWSRLGHHCT